ncbi:MAG TPA: ABC transporter substrate-binding protein [Cyanobacteria bacterium UBA11149]|nr:ABC transporter substrate-binding protein [Cyanobacteria bacterium UBA11367]HBE56449.1 ABC transporter substrate-binding protein [Cyanobacteria bacterium UBA11366]HBK65601.1 ABC transporter substrate-binding protein [Cyanobacteria bacterium UBA11166]HBR74912.1 ABC transporter substrate-binding protein [Cyanobacteria bacterium UBA11159]HBS69634.1 ABC transporter substrate-binding protein [Cyanobacteria bacterium UBA11153]HBW87916.1 ABC transporter substrate-binding protein [Cyanobacteria bac
MKLFKFITFSILCYLCLFLNPYLAWAVPIKIGMSATFTGASRNLGIELYQGAMAYIENVNKSGGINGNEIVIQVYDDSYEPLPALKNTIKLVEQDRVISLFNYVGTPTVVQILPLLKKYVEQNTLLFFPLTGAQPHRQPPYSQYVFNLRASYREETGGIVDNLVKVGNKRIAVFYQLDSYGRSGWDGVLKALQKNDLDIVEEATYRRGTTFDTSFKSQVEAIKKENPDAIISIGSYQACAGFIRDARDGGLNVPIANVSFVGSESLLKLLLEAGDKSGRDYTRNLINSQVIPSYEDLSLPAVEEYRKLIDAYRSQPSKPPVPDDYKPIRYSFVSFEGFLNAKLLVEILKLVPDFSPGLDLRHIVEKVENLDIGIGVPITFSAQKHQALSNVYYTTVESGIFIPIRNWEKFAK